MKRQMTAILTATALALGGFLPAPAHAGKNNELAAFLLFSALLIAATSKDRHKGQLDHRTSPAPRKSRRDTHARPKHWHIAPPAVKPATCLEDFWNGKRWVTFTDRQCRRRHGRRMSRGVDNCLGQEWRRGRWVSSYDRDCMRRHGYTFERRR